ncbi:hypothetical protein ACFQRB_02265 [Halobaculum litoreum]|uniref:Uncharacterized protein n=1 Tax=Halobaculum litoreum TaxID=3031998 RepID=A0ABD5XM69_9EURY
MMGLVTREWMEDRRLLFWSAFVGLAFIVSPDPTGMAPIIVGATMIVLFEGTLALLRWTGNWPRRPRPRRRPCPRGRVAAPRGTLAVPRPTHARWERSSCVATARRRGTATDACRAGRRPS